MNCDPYAAERALSNIVHNAVVYGSENGNVAVVLEVDGGGFELRVSDDGQGVAPDELALLSERTFARMMLVRALSWEWTWLNHYARDCTTSGQLEFAVLTPWA